jgi:ribonucleoside-diphosphate reductase beta chain
MPHEHDKDEILLDPSQNRRHLFPIQREDIWAWYKKQEASIWFAADIDMTNDKPDWEYKLNDDERQCNKNVIGWFAVADDIVAENIMQNFGTEIQIPEVVYFYTLQNYMELIHAETYNGLIDSYIIDPEEKAATFDALDTFPAVKLKADWTTKWMNNNRSLAARLLAFSVVEGVFFSGSFCIIYWMGNRNLLKGGFGMSNEYIARDEGMHTDFAVFLYTNYITHKLSTEEVHVIFKEAVSVETEFIRQCMSRKSIVDGKEVMTPFKMRGMNAAKMTKYIEFVADRLLVQLGYPKIYNRSITESFPWMEAISLEQKTNFFEQRVSSYSKEAGAEEADDAFPTDDDLTSFAHYEMPSYLRKS